MMGRVIMSGIVPLLKAPSAGILAQDIAVGSTVKLMENGAAVEYLVVNQGIPSNSNLYDASCDGTWLLRKDVHSNQKWNTSDVNIYETSAINTWLNGDFFNSLGSVERATVKQVKIPYRHGGGDGGTNQSGANGLSCKVFLLSCYELGWTTSNSSMYPVDGAKLDYFIAGSAGKSLRIAHLNGTVNVWWTRSPYASGTSNAWFIQTDGNSNSSGASNSLGIRPALVLPGNALFDKTTMLLKGVK